MLPKEEREDPEGINFPRSSAVSVEIPDDELVSHVLDILSSKEQAQLAILQLLERKKVFLQYDYPEESFGMCALSTILTTSGCHANHTQSPQNRCQLPQNNDAQIKRPIARKSFQMCAILGQS